MDDDQGGTDWGDFFGGLVRTAGSAYESTQRKPAPQARPAAAPATKPVDWTKILTIGGMVVGGVIVLGLVVKMFKK